MGGSHTNKTNSHKLSDKKVWHLVGQKSLVIIQYLNIVNNPCQNNVNICGGHWCTTVHDFEGANFLSEHQWATKGELCL